MRWSERTSRVEDPAAAPRSDARYRALVDTLRQVIFEMDARGVWTFLNAAWTQITGFPVAGTLGTTVLRYVHPDDRMRHAELCRRLLQRRADDFVMEARYLTAAGGHRWIEVFGQPALDPSGAVRGVLGTLTDITERKHAEAELRATRARGQRLEEERARLSSVVERSTEATLVTDARGVIEFVNPAWERLSGDAAAALVGQDTATLVDGRPDAEFYRMLRRVLESASAWSGRFQSRRRDGGAYVAEAVISPVYDADGRLGNWVAGVHDVTHQQQMEDQLRQAQKMEVAGRLAGGIAHDFNNLLTVIAGRTQLLQRRLTPGTSEAADVELIGETARRAANLTRQLLVFSRNEAVVPQALSLNAVVTGTEKMLRRVIGEDVQLVTRLHETLGGVKADPGQLEQVILNLAVNARDAMPIGGRLSIETAEVEVDEAMARQHVGLSPGPHVTLAVSDTGEGIAPDLLPHIFEPFFTTKGERGTGLGLSTVYGIVTHSGGCVTVQSRPGRGTTFRILLPRVALPALPPEQGPAVAGAPRGTETILVVEDEEDVRTLAREILSEHGYRVLEGRDGVHAMAVGAAHGGPIHLLLTDVVLPCLGGREVADRLQAMRPETRVLFTSGYTDDAVIRHRVSRLQTPLLEKPYGADTLLRAVRRALDTADAPRLL
jgi:two-component system, cell cycle sensor histidine kinase and response regulator CckA